MSMPSPEVRPALSIQDLTVRFGDSVAVDSASFEIPQSASFGLVGESGSGKSTILKAIAGLVSDWSGRITVEGHELKARRDAFFYRTVQMVFQDPYASLHPRHTVDRTLSEPLTLHRFDRIEERIEKVLVQVGLGHDFHTSYLAGSASASPSPVRLCWSPTSSCWTNRPQRWTSLSRQRCSTFSAICNRPVVSHTYLLVMTWLSWRTCATGSP